MMEARTPAPKRKRCCLSGAQKGYQGSPLEFSQGDYRAPRAYGSVMMLRPAVPKSLTKGNFQAGDSTIRSANGTVQLVK